MEWFYTKDDFSSLENLDLVAQVDTSTSGVALSQAKQITCDGKNLSSVTSVTRWIYFAIAGEVLLGGLLVGSRAICIYVKHRRTKSALSS